MMSWTSPYHTTQSDLSKLLHLEPNTAADLEKPQSIYTGRLPRRCCSVLCYCYFTIHVYCGSRILPVSSSGSGSSLLRLMCNRSNIFRLFSPRCPASRCGQDFKPDLQPVGKGKRSRRLSNLVE